MAGPAGGSGGGHRSGGGSSFGGGGGGFGGRGGGYYGGGYYRRPFGFGGGLLGGILGIILLPFIIILLCVIFLIFNLISTISIIANGGQIVYDEEKFQDYANAQYYAHFSDAKTEEDGLMIIILNYEDNQSFSYVAWIGDNVDNRVNDLFASNGEFGRAMESTVNVDNYKYSLSKDLAKVIYNMADKIESRGYDSFVKEHDMSGAPMPELINNSALSLNEETIEGALFDFQVRTRIPVAVLVEEGEAVFGKTMPVGNIIFAVITLIIIGVCVYYIVSKIRRKNRISNDLGSGPRIRVNSTGRRNGF